MDMHAAVTMNNAKKLDSTAGVLCALGCETLFGLKSVDEVAYVRFASVYRSGGILLQESCSYKFLRSIFNRNGY